MRHLKQNSSELCRMCHARTSDFFMVGSLHSSRMLLQFSQHLCMLCDLHICPVCVNEFTGTSLLTLYLFEAERHGKDSYTNDAVAQVDYKGPVLVDCLNHLAQLLPAQMVFSPCLLISTDCIMLISIDCIILQACWH